jgi:hypothetical protein
MKPEGRALAVAQLLRQGYTGGQVSEMLKVTDRGGSMEEAMAALRARGSYPATPPSSGGK